MQIQPILELYEPIPPPSFNTWPPIFANPWSGPVLLHGGLVLGTIKEICEKKLTNFTLLSALDIRISQLSPSSHFVHCHCSFQQLNHFNLTRWLHLMHDQTITIYIYILFFKVWLNLFLTNLPFSVQTGRLCNNKYMLLLGIFTAFFFFSFLFLLLFAVFVLPFALFGWLFHMYVFTSLLAFFLYSSVQFVLLYSGITRGGGAGGNHPGRNSAPPPPMKLHFVQRSMESRHFESQSAPLAHPWAPLAATSFWNIWLHPCFCIVQIILLMFLKALHDPQHHPLFVSLPEIRILYLSQIWNLSYQYLCFCSTLPPLTTTITTK